jgi:UDP-N-acetylmuramyl pentapeptide phosphotransferase/UDP-N-acetylglucosamine-1-phosphate transferase
MVAWVVMMVLQRDWAVVLSYFPFLVGLLIVAVVSFVDDMRSLPDSVRLVAQFVAMALMFWSMGIMHWNMWWIVAIALVVCVGATNVINFMDGINGINGITAGYSLAVLVPLVLLNGRDSSTALGMTGGWFIEQSYLIVAILGVLVFCVFNFRPKGKAKCFAGDVGSISIAFIMLFAIGRLVVMTHDVTYLIFLLVYGVDGCLTICHRILLHENLGEAHRKHAYQLMAKELKIGHVKVSLVYMTMQLAVSFGFIYLCPNTVAAHWGYLVGSLVVLALAYVLFKKKYYHLHEAYLAGLK